MTMPGELLETLFGDEDDLDLGALVSLVEAPGEGLDDDAIEALMREQWGLPVIDAEQAIKATEANHAVRPDNRDEDDFTDEEWVIVQTMRKICLNAIDRDAPVRRRRAAVEWLYVNGTEEPKHGVSFHLACDMLRSRHWVIQALVQHFWFLRSITPGPLPFLADALPEALEGEAIMTAWEPGMQIMAHLWRRPGTPLGEIAALVDLSQPEFEATAHRLVEVGLIGMSMGRAYVASRPATFRRTGQKVSWSRSLIGE